MTGTEGSAGERCCGAVLAQTGLFPSSAADVARHLDLHPEPRSASLARRFVAECAGGAVSPEMAETLALLTSEVVTNAILHARTPLRLGVQHEDRMLVTVAGRNLVQPEQQPYSEERTDGRGIVLLEALADQWGITNYDGGMDQTAPERVVLDSLNVFLARFTDTGLVRQHLRRLATELRRMRLTTVMTLENEGDLGPRRRRWASSTSSPTTSSSSATSGRTRSAGGPSRS